MGGKTMPSAYAPVTGTKEMSRAEREQEIRQDTAENLRNNMGKNRMKDHVVPWTKYVQTADLSKEEADAVAAFDKLRDYDGRQDVLDGPDGPVVAASLVKLLGGSVAGGSVDRKDMMYVLFMIDGMLE